MGRLSAHECQTQAQTLRHRSGFLLAHSHHTTLIPDVTSYHMIVLLWLAKNNHHKWSWGGENVSALFYTLYARFYSLQSFQHSFTHLLNDPLVTISSIPICHSNLSVLSPIPICHSNLLFLSPIPISYSSLPFLSLSPLSHSNLLFQSLIPNCHSKFLI